METLDWNQRSKVSLGIQLPASISASTSRSACNQSSRSLPS
jgi:hypothetical protein